MNQFRTILHSTYYYPPNSKQFLLNVFGIFDFARPCLKGHLNIGNFSLLVHVVKCKVSKINNVLML